MLKRSITLIGLGCTISGIPCLALDLGPVQQQSYMDEPLAATVDILDIGALNMDSVSVAVADVAEFAQRGLSVKNFFADLEVQVISAEGKTPFVQLSSTEPVQRAILNFALKAQWENGSVIQQYTVLMKDPPADNVENFSEDGALSALSDLEMLESEAMSTQQDHNNDTVWNLDKDLANRTEWKVSDERSLQEVAVHIRPSNAVSIEQTLVALIKKNANVVQQRQSLALSQGDLVQLPTHEEITSVNKLTAVHELGALQARFQVADSAANEPSQTASASLAQSPANGLPGGRLRLGRPEPTSPNNAQSAEKPMKQQNSDRTKSTDLARRLENAVARLGDANHVINTHLREIGELNLLVEDLKHTIDLKNAELADMQARALGAMQAQDSVENSAKAGSESETAADNLPTTSMNDESKQSDVQTKAVTAGAGSTNSTHSILGGFLAIVAAMFSIITFARYRARLSESRAARETLEQERSASDAADNIVQDTSLHFEDEDLQRLVDQQKGSVIGEAEVLTAHGLHTQAIAHLKAALEKNPESGDLIGALREALILSGQYEQAAELFPDLESANDNAVIDSDYIKQTLVIDDLEEPFDESRPPVWEPPAATNEPSAVAQEEAPKQPEIDKNESVSTSAAARDKKTTAAEKAAAKKQSRRAKKAKAGKRQQQQRVITAKKTSAVGKKVEPREELKTPQATQTDVVQTKVQIADKPALTKPVSSETALPKNDAKAAAVEEPAIAVAKAKTIDQQVENDKDNIEMLIGNTDIFTEVEATPFELVQAYLELDDRDGARRMLEDILGDGKPNEKARAKELLEEIA